MKAKFLILLFLVFGFKAYSQHKNISIGPEINIPSGNASNIVSIGFGGYLKGELGLSQKFSITATGSLTNFLGKKFLGIRSQNLTYLPVRLGVKYYPSENSYFEGQVGSSFPVSGDSKTAFAWSPGLGTFLTTQSGNKLDFSLRYEAQTTTVQNTQLNKSYSSFGYIGLRFGYVFGN